MDYKRTDEIRIFFFGDSICFGQGVSIHKGWVSQISAAVDSLAQELGKKILLVNSAVNGNTTRLALERMPYEIQSHAPDILIIQYGMNDCNFWESDRGLPRVSEESFKANLKEIIARGLNFGAKKIIVNTNHPTGRTDELMPCCKVTYQESNATYNAIIRVVVEETPDSVILNDMEKQFFSKMEQNNCDVAQFLLPAPDLLHLNEKGHQLYFQAIFPPIKDTILNLKDKGNP